MKLDVFDATVESATLRRATSKHSMFSSILFKLADGSSRQMDKVAAAPDVAALLQPGAQGRFYSYTTIDHKGIIALRGSDGRSAYGVPSGNERIMLMMAIIGLGWFVGRLLIDGHLALLSVILGVAGVFGYVSYRRLRMQSRARFDADAGAITSG